MKLESIHYVSIILACFSIAAILCFIVYSAKSWEVYDANSALDEAYFKSQQPGATINEKVDEKFYEENRLMNIYGQNSNYSASAANLALLSFIAVTVGYSVYLK